MVRSITLFFFLLLLFQHVTIKAQSTYQPLNTGAYQLLDRYEVLSGRIDPSIHSSLKPYNRESINRFIDSLPAASIQTRQDSFNVNYFKTDSWEWSNAKVAESEKSIFKRFYKKKADFYSVNEKDFDLHINPILYVTGGNSGGNPSSSYTYLNTRGVEVRGRIAKRIGFYTMACDNQGIFPNYVNDKVNYYTLPGSATPIVPYEAFAKPFKTTNGYDFFTARGYVTFELVKKYIDVQVGYDKNFIGNGYRSLELSDVGGPYSFIKLNTRIWRFQYQNIFAQMIGQLGDVSAPYPKKYASFHHLSLNVTKNLNIGFFESIIFGAADSSKQGSFQVAYMNPVIFYQAIEPSTNGTHNNSMLGFDFKYNFLKHFSWYGQIVLDEFILKDVVNHTGWWGNKQALQLGLKYFNALGIKHLDLQGELDIVRPYMYTHVDSYTSYTNYNQPLADPMGANFKEFIGIARYQPLPKLTIQGKGIYYIWGDDSSTTSTSVSDNNGGNIFKSYTPIAVANTYHNKIGQGIKTDILFLSLQLSYQIRHNMFIDITGIYRNQTSQLSERDSNTKYISCGIRMNIQPRNYEF